MYDVAVMGLGPAGSFFAMHADKKFKIIALDKKHEQEGSFKKPCGGLLAPDAQKALSRFNMTLPKDILVGPQIFSVRTLDLSGGLVRHYQRCYINLDRHKFDLWLMSQIPDNVELRPNTVCTQVLALDNGFAVTFIEGGKEKTIHARYVVGADGAASVVRRSLYRNFHIHTYLSIQQWFPDAHDTPFYSCVFDPSVTDSYAWGLTKDNSFIFGGAFSVKTGKKDFEILKGKLRQNGFRLDNPLKTEACLVLRPSGFGNYCTGENGSFLTGEAAGFISPSSLEGISYAIDSGYLLSQCLNHTAGDPNRAYAAATRKIRFKLLMKCVKRPFMYNPAARRIIMNSGVSSITMLE